MTTPKKDEKVTPRKWLLRFDSRKRQQIEFSRLYASQFGHGAQGHNDMEIISEMSYILDAFDTVMAEKNEETARLARENGIMREELTKYQFNFDKLKLED